MAPDSSTRANTRVPSSLIPKPYPGTRNDSVAVPSSAGTLPPAPASRAASITTTAAVITRAAASATAPPLRRADRRRCPRNCRSSAPGSGRIFCVAMRNTSCTSGIPRSFLRSEGPAALGRQGPDGRGTDAQDARRLLGRVAEQIHEQEGGSLANREAEEEPLHVRTHLRLGEQVALLREGSQLEQHRRGSTPTHPEAVQRDAEQVAGRVRDPFDPVPPLPELHER